MLADEALNTCPAPIATLFLQQCRGEDLRLLIEAAMRPALQTPSFALAMCSSMTTCAHILGYTVRQAHKEIHASQIARIGENASFMEHAVGCTNLSPEPHTDNELTGIIAASLGPLLEQLGDNAILSSLLEDTDFLSDISRCIRMLVWSSPLFCTGLLRGFREQRSCTSTADAPVTTTLASSVETFDGGQSRSILGAQGLVVRLLAYAAGLCQSSEESEQAACLAVIEAVEAIAQNHDVAFRRRMREAGMLLSSTSDWPVTSNALARRVDRLRQTIRLS